MSRVFVPVSAQLNQDLNKTLAELKKVGASRVYITICERYPFEKGERRDRILASLKNAIAFFDANGFETSVWTDSIGFGSPIPTYNVEVTKNYTRLRSITGKGIGDAFCPLDENFTNMYCELIADIARAGAKMIMLDDELCLSVRPGLGCACDLHLAELSKRLGEEMTLEGLPEKLFTGGKNKYRDAWLDLMGETLASFCAKIRAAVDTVDPKIRLGFCAGYTSWDTEGIDALSLTKVLAGKNKPFLRFTGAPYWLSTQRFGRMTLQTIIETARMQYAWSKESGVEVFTEVDTYPRDRYHTPAAYSECFDLATRVSDDMDALKYMFNYCCPPEYERGYVREHASHIDLYRDIERVYHSKKAVGIRVYEEMRKLKNADLPEKFLGEKDIMKRFAFSSAQRILTSNAIPTVYEGDGLCGIAFGENAKYLPDAAYGKGLILDVAAAEYLQANGIDTGLRSVADSTTAVHEIFENGYPYTEHFDTGSVCLIETDQKANVLSYFTGYEMLNDKKTPAAYRYENANGQRFLVYACRADALKDSSTVFWSYGRAAQIAENIEWLGGAPLPAACLDHPHLYALCKEGDGAVTMGYFNCHVDELNNTKVTFAKKIKSVEILNGEGTVIDDHTVVIKHIKAYGYLGINAITD